MNLDSTLPALVVGAVTGMVSGVITTKVMLAVLYERVNNTVDRLDRIERLLERLIPPMNGGKK